MRACALMGLVAACSPVRELSVNVEIAPEVQDAYDDAVRGEVLVYDEALDVVTTVGVLCEPEEEDVVFTWGASVAGCATPSTVTAWIRLAAFEAPCGPQFYTSEGQPEGVDPRESGTAFADADPRRCPSGSDTITLRFD